MASKDATRRERSVRGLNERTRQMDSIETATVAENSEEPLPKRGFPIHFARPPRPSGVHLSACGRVARIVWEELGTDKRLFNITSNPDEVSCRACKAWIYADGQERLGGKKRKRKKRRSSAV